MVKEWQNRPLDALYPIIFMDAIHFKVRHEGRIQSKATYVVLGVTIEGFKEVTADLKPIYKASTEELALEALSEFDEKWGKKYPIITKSWMDDWSELATFFKYPAELRRIIYTTNVIEGFHRQLRKPTKSKSVFPSDESLLKMLYLVTMDVTKNGP